MSNKESLIGKTVTLFLDGGWQITGEVKSFDDNRFTVEQDGNLFMVFKEKVACLLMSETDRAVPLATTSSKNLKANRDDDFDVSTFPMNSISYDESNMSIPGALLSNVPKDNDDDLSVFFTGGSALPSDDKPKEGLEPLDKSNMTFEVGKDDTED